MKHNSQREDLIEEYIEKSLKNEVDNMQSVNIPNDIMSRLDDRCKKIHCNPEKLIHAILFDYLKSVDNVSGIIDHEKLQAMLEHDNPEGDDILDNISRLGDVGWE